MRDILIRLDSVAMRFGVGPGSVQALLETNLQISAGEFVILIGPSGCGKTTLLRMMAGLQRPSSGRVGVRTRNSAALGDPNTSDVDLGVVFQDASLLPWMSVADNIALPLKLIGRPAAERRARVTELCRLVEIEGFEDRWPRELSGGMQQRAAIARALSRQPSILLMDEPFGALDAMTRDHMNLEVQRIALATGCTIVMVTHSINEAVFLGDRVVCLASRPGHVVEIVEVPFPRPRDLSVIANPKFQELALHLRSRMGGGK